MGCPPPGGSTAASFPTQTRAANVFPSLFLCLSKLTDCCRCFGACRAKHSPCACVPRRRRFALCQPPMRLQRGCGWRHGVVGSLSSVLGVGISAELLGGAAGSWGALWQNCVCVCVSEFQSKRERENIQSYGTNANGVGFHLSLQHPGGRHLHFPLLVFPTCLLELQGSAGPSHSTGALPTGALQHLEWGAHIQGMQRAASPQPGVPVPLLSS